MENKKLMTKQFIIGAFVISLLLSIFWLFWAIDNTPKKGQNVSDSYSVYFLNITPEIFLFKVEINPSFVSFSFGIMFFILVFIGGLFNIIMYNKKTIKNNNEGNK